MTDVVTYKGVPLQDLRVEEVVWDDEASEHIRTRSLRKGPNEVDIEPEWATEAVLNGRRFARVAAANDPETASLKIIGRSVSAEEQVPGGLLKVWIWSDDPTSSTWNGASACVASDSDARRYRRLRGEET